MCCHLLGEDFMLLEDHFPIHGLDDSASSRCLVRLGAVLGIEKAWPNSALTPMACSYAH